MGVSPTVGPADGKDRHIPLVFYVDSTRVDERRNGLSFAAIKMKGTNRSGEEGQIAV